MLPNEVLENPNLSWKAKGIFGLLASKPDDWNFYMEQISNYATDKQGALKSGVKELEEAGYLVRKIRHTQENKFAGMEWILTVPDSACSRQAENPSDGNSVSRKTIRHNNTNNTNTDNTNTKKPLYDDSERTWWFISYWNRLYNAEVRFTEKKKRQVVARLKVFSAEEIVRSMKNRSNDVWLENNGFMKDWDSFWRNNEKVERYLNKETDRSPF